MIQTTPLTEHDFVTLDKLSRKAADDSMRAHGGHVTEDDRFDSLAMHLLETGVRAWRTYDTALAGGVSRETHAYRKMRGWRAGNFTNGPYIDWVRRTVRDSRFEPDIRTVLTTDGTLPDIETEHDDTLDAVIAGLTHLGSMARWALTNIARPMAEHDRTIAEAARNARVSVAFAEVAMATLADELRPGWTPTQKPSTTILDFASMVTT